MSIAEFCRTLLVCIDPLIKQTLDTTLSPIRLLEAHPECVCVCVCVCVCACAPAGMYVCVYGIPIAKDVQGNSKKTTNKIFYTC